MTLIQHGTPTYLDMLFKSWSPKLSPYTQPAIYVYPPYSSTLDLSRSLDFWHSMSVVQTTILLQLCMHACMHACMHVSHSHSRSLCRLHSLAWLINRLEVLPTIMHTIPYHTPCMHRSVDNWGHASSSSSSSSMQSFGTQRKFLD